MTEPDTRPAEDWTLEEMAERARNIKEMGGHSSAITAEHLLYVIERVKRLESLVKTQERFRERSEKRAARWEQDWHTEHQFKEQYHEQWMAYAATVKRIEALADYLSRYEEVRRLSRARHAEMIRHMLSDDPCDLCGCDLHAAARDYRGQEVVPQECICPKFGDIAPYRMADLTCPIHGVNGTQPGDWIEEDSDARQD